MTALPIDKAISELAHLLTAHNQLIVRAAPGSGKTTRIPPALLQHLPGKILVLEPRRLAAALAADYIAKQMGETCGNSVGYQVRFDNKTSPSSRLIFMTEGILIRRFLSDPQLNDVSCIVLDEFHERHIHTDVALALSEHLQRRRPDLKIIVMSATLEMDDLRSYFPNAATIDVDVPRFPVQMLYAPDPRLNITSPEQIAAAVRRVDDLGFGGDILIFQPGTREIEDICSHLRQSFGASNEILPLYAALPAARQAAVFATSAKRKIIVATNVAESAITIAGVRVVIDTGVAKIPSQAAWSGLPTLQLRPISQSSCIQRAGRAGREAPGLCIRLYSEADFLGRRPFEAPEIQRLDVTQLLLELKAIGNEYGDQNLRWLSPIDTSSRTRCISILQWLGALDADEALTDLGRAMAQLPLHPRLSRLCLAGRDYNTLGPSIIAAALLQEGIPTSLQEPNRSADNDLSCAIGRILRAHGSNMIPANLARTVRQIAQILKTDPQSWNKDFSEDDLAQALLTAFPDRVAKRRTAATARPEYALSVGGGAVLADTCKVRDHDWLVALDAIESPGKTAAIGTRISVACAIDTENLSRMNTSLWSEAAEVIWDDNRQIARALIRKRYGQLIAEERPNNNAERADLERVLSEQLRAQWPKPFTDVDALHVYQARCNIVKQVLPDVPLLDLAGSDFELLLASICEGKKSFTEVAAKTLPEYITDNLSYEAQRALDEYAPLRIKMTNGRLVDIHYEIEQAPWIASRLQDFFGSKITPTIAGGRVALLVHLLAPNKRPVQVTQDLVSFWQNSYPKLRGELSRNYPKHAWPEDPANATPPPLGKLR